MPSINREQGQSWPSTTTWRFWQNADGSISQAAHIEGQLPTALGQKTKATALGVTLASDEDALAVTGPLTDTQLRDSDVPVTLDGETVIATGSTATVSQTPTITAGAYSAKDAVGGLLTFAGAARESGGSITIQTVTITDLAAQSAGLVLVLFDRTFTATADNAAFDPSDADLANFIGIIPVYASDYQAFADNAGACVRNVGLAATLNGTSLFGQLMCTGAPTYASTSDLEIKLTIYQD